MKTNSIAKLLKDEAGNVLALSAAGMLVLVALVGSALDLSVTYMARGKLQNACDAAVLAARQSMTGTEFNQDVEDEADRFFDFNFPEGTSGAEDVTFAISQNADDGGELEGAASATIPTTLVRVIGIDDVEISVNCDAVQDTGHNDIVLVLDVTGSMNDAPSNGGGTKIARLQEGTLGLYRALETEDGSITRYGIVPYSQTVNVARSLHNRDILVTQQHAQGEYWDCDVVSGWLQNCAERSETNGLAFAWTLGSNDRYRWFGNSSLYDVHISDSRWNNASGTYPGNRQGFRTSGEGCIEERPTIDPSNPATSGQFIIRDYVTRADIDDAATNGNDTVRQFGRYDMDSQSGYTHVACPSEATRLTQYDDEASFDAAIEAATANVTGNTYHDVGMLWGARFASRTGFFEGENFNQGDNITEIDGVPVNTHIVFMTDGIIMPNQYSYAAHGVEWVQDRTQGTGSLEEQHLARFESVCTLAKEMGITIWVIALDVTDTDDIEPCATSENHFYTSDGSDLEEIFEAIGQGIGNLRLTR